MLFEFLCVNVDDWELLLGKVICLELFECLDLVLEMIIDVLSDSSSFMGVKLVFIEFDILDYVFIE